jgi:hypothetical protein
MALVQLSNVILPEVYLDLPAVNSPEKHQLVQSGLVLRDAMFDDIINNMASERPNLPFWNDLDLTSEASYSDDSENSVTPGNVTQSKMSARVCYMNKSYKSADLVKQRIKSDPMQQIRNRFANYWSGQFQRRVSSTLLGVLASNVANNAGDMVNDVHGATNADVNNNTLFTQQNFINAALTMGDRFDETSVLYMHSIVYGRLLAQNQIITARTSEGQILYPTYMNHRVIVEDNASLVTAAAGAAGGDAAAKYVTVIAAPGAVAYGQGYPDIPVEVYRLPLQGNGGGTEAIIERVNMLIHPFGHTWNESSIGLYSPTIAELQEAAQWTRVVERKVIPLAFLITNG